MSNMVTNVVMQLVDRVSGPARRLQQSLSGLSRRAGFDRLSASARRLGTSMRGVIDQARGLTQRLAIIGGATAGAIWGMERLVSGVTDVGTAVKESSERLGVGTTWLQEWQQVGRQFGVQNEALVDGLKELSLRADEFVVTAGGPAADAFKRLGVGMDELRKTEGRTEALFDLVRSKLAEVENDAERQRIMDEIFGGQGGEQMVEMLQASREEIEKMMTAAHERGAILSPEEIENSRQYTRQMSDFRQVLFGIQTQVVGQLLPGITEWIKSTGVLAAENRKAIGRDIVEGLKAFWGGLKRIGQAAGWAASLVGGFGNLAAIVAGVFAGKFLVSVIRAGLSVFQFGRDVARVAMKILPRFITGVARASVGLLRLSTRAVAGAVTGLAGLARGMIGVAARAIPAAIAGVRALSLALLTTPVGWIITGVTAVAGAVYLIYRNWDGIAEWFSGLWQGIKGFFSQGIGEIVRDLLSFSPAALLMKGIDAVFELFGARPLTEIGQEWIGGLWGGICERWTQLTGWLSQKMTELTGWLPDWAKDRLGLGSVAAPQASGAPVSEGRPSAMPAPARAEVGGELRIVVDSEGRPRVAEARRKGGMDFDVESGVLGVAP